MMKLTAHDKPIGSALAGSVIVVEEPKPMTDAEAMRQAGLHHKALWQFRRRHPELAHWSRERIIEQILANKDQSAVARRQGQAGRSFGKMRYDDGKA